MSPAHSASALRPVRARRPVRHRRRRVVAAVAVLVVLLAGVVTWRVIHNGDSGLAGQATVTASSTALGSSPRDAVGSGSATQPDAGWQSAGQTTGAWLQLSWSSTHAVRRVVIVRNPLTEPGVTAGWLSFGDGSAVQVALSATDRVTTVPFTPRSVQQFRFTASQVSAGARSVTLSEILVATEADDDLDVATDAGSDGNVAPRAAVTEAGGGPGTAAGPADAQALVDGHGGAGTAGTGADWTTVSPAETSVQLAWVRPRELSSVEIVGSVRTSARLAGATLTFGDGSRLPIGAVLPDAEHPTVVAFMPRVTTAVRLTLDRLTGSGPLALAELRLYQRGATPPRPVSTASAPAVAGGSPCGSASAGSPGAGSLGGGLVVRCPTAGSAVQGPVSFQVTAPRGDTAVTATVWPGDEDVAAGVPVSATPDAAGVAHLDVDASAVPPGPLTVRFVATGAGRDQQSVDFPLYRSGSPAGDVPSSPQANGRTLAYAEEFDHPVTLSRTGIGADYAAAKPTDTGAEDFGAAIFPDPAADLGNVGVVDDRYLRIAVEPDPPGFTDPAGSGRTHIGGLVASARQGGSGFSAQYGYFEARMLVPVANGTWPAFWALPSDNLVLAQPAVAELDAVELYGHDPDSACHSTHEYVDGHDGGIAQCGQRFESDRSAASWHTYGMSVTPTDITFFIDGRTVATAPQVRGGDAPLFFLVDLALGGGWPVDLSALQDRGPLYVDDVRVYV